MPIDIPHAHRIRAQALVTDIELEHGPNFMLAYIREKVRDELFDAIVRSTMQTEDIPGGRRYWMDVLVLTPDALLCLVQREAQRVLEEHGYALGG